MDELDEQTPQTDTFNWELARLWLRTCENEHGEDCAPRIQAPEVIDTLLVDVFNHCLVPATSATRYVALSYVWGQVQQFQTTTATLPDLLQPNGLPVTELPNTIRDAITAARSMGERFLWVDALCIPQDDFAIKHFQIAHMATIYTSAVLTIVAASSNNAESLLPGVQSQSRWLRPWNSSNSVQLNRPARPALVLKAVDRSLYNSRAWTFQERHLSPRCLCFLDEQVYFQCQKELWCEEPPATNSSRFQNLYQIPGKIDLSLTIMSTVRDWGKNVEKAEWDAAFRFYAQVIQDYSWKLLTFPEDVTAAFSGIAATLEQHSGWTITHGLAEELFDWALLWIPVGGMHRRPQPRSLSESPFPSWSWVGWVGPVSYNLAYVDALVDLKTFVTDWKIEQYSPVRNPTTSETEQAPAQTSGQPDTRHRNRNLQRQVLGKKYIPATVGSTGQAAKWEWTIWGGANQRYVRRTHEVSLPGIGLVLSFTAQAGEVSHFHLTTLVGEYFDPATHFDKRGARTPGQPVVVISISTSTPSQKGSRTVGMFYGIDADTILRRLPSCRLLRLSATNIQSDDTTLLSSYPSLSESGLFGKGGLDYVFRGEDIRLWEAYNGWKGALSKVSSATGNERGNGNGGGNGNRDRNWMLYNVMLVSKSDTGEGYERLAIGQLEPEAWESCSPREERVRLL